MVFGERFCPKVVRSLANQDSLLVCRRGLFAVSCLGLQCGYLNKRLYQKIGYVRFFKDGPRLGHIDAGRFYVVELQVNRGKIKQRRAREPGIPQARSKPAND